MADLIRWDDSPAGMLAGYVGTTGVCLLEIFEPDGFSAEWVLQSFLPGQAGRRHYGDGPDDLKVAAEAWLREFGSSIGAVFPDADRWQFLKDWVALGSDDPSSFGGQDEDAEAAAYRAVLEKMTELEGAQC